MKGLIWDSRLNVFLPALLLASLCSLFIGSPSHATDYSDIQYTNSIKLDRKDYNGITCTDPTDISQSWAGYLTDTDTPFMSNTGLTKAQAKSSFQTALQTGSWAVSQVRQYNSGSTDYVGNNIGYEQTVQIVWQETDNSFELTYSSDGNLGGYMYNYLAIGSSKFYSARISYKVINDVTMGNCVINVSADVNDIGSPYNLYFGNNGAKQYMTDDRKIFLISAYNIPNPPESYVPPPTTNGDPGPVIPNLNDDISLYWKTEDKLVTLVHKTSIPPLDLETMTCRWQFTDQDGNKLIDKVTPCNEDNFQQVEVDKYGPYQVNLDILYDKNEDTVILPEESIASIQSNIEVYGEFKEGMIGHDWFEENTDYKDCTTYGTDLAGAFGCHLFNFGLRIRDFFVPDATALRKETTEFLSYMEDKLGFVWQAVGIPLGLFGAVVDGAANPTCSLTLGQLSGQNVSISLCQVRGMVGSGAFDLAINIFRGAIALGFLFSLQRYANRFFSNRTDGEV